MRDVVTHLVSLGRLPDEREAGVSQLQVFEAALKNIERPVSSEEALALLSVFPATESSCFGLAWSLLHLVESAPAWPGREALLQEENPWVKTMLQRAARA
jgi:hypothetical protein